MIKDKEYTKEILKWGKNYVLEFSLDFFQPLEEKKQFKWISICFVNYKSNHKAACRDVEKTWDEVSLRKEDHVHQSKF